jgi:hypothetical protein
VSVKTLFDDQVYVDVHSKTIFYVDDNNNLMASECNGPEFVWHHGLGREIINDWLRLGFVREVGDEDAV